MIDLQGVPKDPDGLLQDYLDQVPSNLRTELEREPTDEEIQAALASVRREFRIALNKQFAIALERSPGQWNEKGLTLSLAADILFDRWLPSHQKQQEILKTPFVLRDVETKNTITQLQIETQLAFVATMLRAMAIEAFLKGRFYELEIARKGHVTKADRAPLVHDLIGLASRIGIALTEEEVEILENLRDMYEMGRYPRSIKGRLSLSSANEDEKTLMHSLVERADRIIAEEQAK